MTEEERRQDEALKTCIQEAYGCTDEELLAELAEIEASLTDDDFPGLEARARATFAARIAEEERLEEEHREAATVDGMVDVPVDGPAEKNVVRFGKKKMLLVAALAAAFVGVLGITAIGGKTYFFRSVRYADIVQFNNDENKNDGSDIEEMYTKIEKELDIVCVKLGYIPKGMIAKELSLSNFKAIIRFEYDGNDIYYTQIRRDKESVFSSDSDRKIGESIYNEWLNISIEYKKNLLENNMEEYEATFVINDTITSVFGIMEEAEFKKILKYLNFS